MGRVRREEVPFVNTSAGFSPVFEFDDDAGVLRGEGRELVARFG